MHALSKRVRVPLQYPVEVDGVRYSALSLRAAKPSDLGRLELSATVPTSTALPASLVEEGDTGAKHARGIALVARMAGVPPAVLYALHPDDAERVGRQAETMLTKVL